MDFLQPLCPHGVEPVCARTFLEKSRAKRQQGPLGLGDILRVPEQTLSKANHTPRTFIARPTNSGFALSKTLGFPSLTTQILVIQKVRLGSLASLLAPPLLSHQISPSELPHAH